MPSKRDPRNNSAPPEFAYLGLHQAALSGNIGLVQYALSQGQPVDAVWDGISALHAAAAGGSEHVARLLIESGADTSFGRLPRNERELKARTASSSSSSTPLDKVADPRNPRAERAPPSTSAPDALLNAGSTPLHFACAHNHTAVARLLLAHGAAPHIPDRRGVTPLDLLPPASPEAAADSLRTVIREYYEAEKAKEKEFQKNPLRFHGKAAAVLGFPREDEASSSSGTAGGGTGGGGSSSIAIASGTRVGVKRSLENLLSKSPKHTPPPLAPSPGRRTLNGIGTPPPSPRRPSAAAPPSPTSPARFTFGAATPPSFASTAPPPPPPAPPDFSPPPPPPLDQRRPSLPHLFDAPPPSPPAALRPAAPGARPRSAGSGGDRPPRTKRSLLSLFKKGEFSEERAARRAEDEVRTAPAGRTTFAAHADDVFCDDDEDYGVPLTRTPELLPPELPYAGDEESDEEYTAEDEARDPALDLDRTSTGATVRPRAGFVPPPHAEGWYRDRGAAPRAGILRSDRSVRKVGSLRFEAERARGGGRSRSSSGSADGRGRAGSVSSASTDLSAPALSQGASSGTADGEGEARAVGLSLRTVANHAQAEALVQRAAKEILEGAGGAGTGLSAQLAAYGETLQLERRFARGEAQRWRSAGAGEEAAAEEGEVRREGERRAKAQERMVWSQKVMERYAREREGSREKRGGEAGPVGVPLGRTASLEKEMEVGTVRRPPKTRQQRMRRPHTSDSVTTPDGNPVPPRFGHSTTYSTSSALRATEAGEPMRVFHRERRAHHPARSASVHPRAESLDHDRAPPADAPLVRYSSRDDPDLQLPRRPALALDEFGASTTSIRPVKQRFGGLRSLFGKGK